MRNLKLFIPFIIFLVLAVLLFRGLGRDPTALPSALIGEPVPAFSLPDLFDENKLITEDVFVGAPTVLNVWATWCPSCKLEHPFLLDLAAQGVRIVGLDYKDDNEPALRWLKDLGNPYRVTIADRRGALGLDLGVYGAPETYIIDAQGIIRAKHVGVLDQEIWRELGAVYDSLVVGKP